MPRGIYHIHQRKRKNNNLEKYPSKNKYIKFLDKLLIVVAIISPLLTLPQVIKIFYLKTALGVSMTAWLAFAIFDIPWIIYGFAHKEKPIIIMYSLLLITNLLVVLGIILYG